MAITTKAGSAIAFKDWAIIGAAFNTGRQHIILRKGGLIEGRAGFRFKHSNFFLFPTQYHEQMEKIREEEKDFLIGFSPQLGKSEDQQVSINTYFQVAWSGTITSWEIVKKLTGFHIYREDVIRERDEYEYSTQTAGIHLAFGRAFKVNPTWEFQDLAKYGGCRSWLENLPAPPENLNFEPVISEEEFGLKFRQFKELVENDAVT